MARLGVSLARVALGDLAQRLLTGNKRNQRRRLGALLNAMGLPNGPKTLDFGCGTRLFAPVFAREGLSYNSLDICGYPLFMGCP